jgi:signal transduction histidine kinase
VHRAVNDYGGTIQVESTVGRGTTVRVRLPVRGSAPLPVPASSPQGAAS